MGRLRTWIDRVRTAQTRRSGKACVLSRRRLLAFEQVESRIVMSAAVQSAWAAGDQVLSDGALLQDLWVATPGASQWGEVTFSPAPSELSGDAARTISLSAFGFGRTPMVREGVAAGDGGLIEFSPMVSQNVAAQFRLNVTPWITQAAFNRGNTNVEETFGDPLSMSVGNSTGLDLGGLISSNDAVAPNGVGEVGTDDQLFGDPALDSSLGAASEPASPATESPMLRITSPLSINDSEGGTIDLTAMVAPKAAFTAEVASRVATDWDSSAGDSLRLVSTASTRKTLARADAGEDGLRARAVVLDVALSQDSDRDGSEATQADRLPAPQTPAKPSAPGRRLERDATHSAPVRAAAIAPGDAPVETAPSDRVSADGTPAAEGDSQNRAAAHDAAIGELETVATSRLAAGIDATSTRQQTVGLALALVAGATPLIKRARRRRSTRLPQESPADL